MTMVTTRSITDHPTDHHQATDHHHHSADHDQNIDQDPRMGMINDHDVDQIWGGAYGDPSQVVLWGWGQGGSGPGQAGCSLPGQDCTSGHYHSLMIMMPMPMPMMMMMKMRMVKLFSAKAGRHVRYLSTHIITLCSSSLSAYIHWALKLFNCDWAVSGLIICVDIQLLCKAIRY